MNENTKKFLKQLKKGIRLTSVFEYLHKSNANEIHVFLKVAGCFDNRNIRHQTEFWRSQLRIIHLNISLLWNKPTYMLKATLC